MIGRLIVAALVIASAAFVMLSRRETESTSIEVNLTELRARDAEARAVALDHQVAELKEKVAKLEGELQVQGDHLVELTEDCTPTAPEGAQLTVASFKRRDPAGDVMGPREIFRSGRVDERFAVVLKGEATTVTRVRLYSSADDGTPLRHTPSCDTLETDDAVALLGVFASGRAVSGDFGRQAIAKAKGVVPLELRCDMSISPFEPVTLEVIAEGGGSARATLAPLARPAPLPGGLAPRRAR